MLKKILVPVDGSTLSEKVLPYALKLAARLDLQITLLRVIEKTDYLDQETFENSKSAQEARKYLSGISDGLIAGRENPLISSDRLETKLLYGNPAEVICRYASEENFDLVTMTTHGQPQTYEYFLGSVTRKVLQQLAVPVLLVRPYGQRTQPEYGLSETLACLDEPFGKRFLANGVRFVLPLDMSDKSEASLNLSFELAQRLDATIYLLKVVNPAPAPQSSGPATGSAATLAGAELARRNEANLYLKQIESLARKNEVEAVKIVLTGNPATEILAFAELMAPDALIMATRAFGDADTSRLPSLTHEMMRRSHIPVFMVPIGSPAARKTQDMYSLRNI